MAAKPSTPPSKSNRLPLADFDRLEPFILLSKSPPAAESDTLIIATTWMAAASKHIAKYTATYRERFPSAQILIIRNSLWNAFKPQSTTIQTLAPALAVLNAHVAKTKDNPRPSILLHSYSNGGGLQLWKLSQLFEEEHGYPIPARVLAMDSSPGKPTYERTYAATILSLPRTWFFRVFGPALVHLMVLVYFIISKTPGCETPVEIMFRELNNPKLVDSHSKRVYLYSKADLMILDDDVEEHADDASRKGWPVDKVKFESSPHAGHIMEDSEKYWKAIERAWTS